MHQSWLSFGFALCAMPAIAQINPTLVQVNVEANNVSMLPTTLFRLPAKHVNRLPASALIDSYGSFSLAMLPNAALTALSASADTDIAVYQGGYALALPNDSQAVDPQQRSAWNRSANFAVEQVYLLQFHGPTKPEWIAALRAQGVDAFQYVHPFSYLVWNRSGQLARAANSIPAVRWVGEYPITAKLSAAAMRSGSRAWRIVSYRGGDLAAAKLQQLGAQVQSYAAIDAVMEHWVVDVSPAALEVIARLPSVLSIQDLPVDGGNRGELAAQQLAGNVLGDVPQRGYLSWLNGFGLNGAGVLLANVDTGVDQNHPDLITRVQACVGITCGGAASSQHGTHTAGAMVGNAASGAVDARGFLRGLGAGPAAKIVEQVYSGFFNQAGGMLLLMRESAANGAYLSNNSWGPAASPRGYDAQTREVDVGTRDTDPRTAGDQPLLFVLSIMNGNGGLSSQGTPDEAKNVLTVGSTRSQQSGNVADANWQSVSNNSGHGPALDGRLIPHLTAPGCSTDSTSPNGGYALLCGTSMASPLVSGGISVFLQAYKSRFQNRLPSPELTKAYAIASAVDLFGSVDADGAPLTRRPNPQQGFGALRLGEMLEQFNRTLLLDRPQVFTQSGQRFEVSYRVKDPTKPVKIVMAFTDAPGAGTCASSTCITPAWVNDLDLEVAHLGQRYRGNAFASSGFSATSGTADPRNNMELIALPAGTSGELAISVLASNIAGDALPNSPGALQQDLSLVCVNCSDARFLVSEPATVTPLCSQNPIVPPQMLDVSAVSGFNGNMSAQLQLPLPIGYTLSITPSSFSPPATLMLTGSVALGTSGSATVGLNVSDGETTQTRSITFESVNAAPTQPILAALNATQPLRPALTWSSVALASALRLEISRQADFSTSVLVPLAGSALSWQPNANLSPGTRYYWRLRASNACGDGALSSTQNFVTEPGADSVFASGFEDL